jgi:hypothetical protein
VGGEPEMTEEEQFKELVNHAVANRTDEPPSDPKEFDIYADMHYNLYMFIKGEWTSIGLNVTPI